jgi:hypothetical protein
MTPIGDKVLQNPHSWVPWPVAQRSGKSHRRLLHEGHHPRACKGLRASGRPLPFLSIPVKGHSTGRRSRVSVCWQVSDVDILAREGASNGESLVILCKVF